MRKLILLMMVFYLSDVVGANFFSDVEQECGYIKVREYAYTFWWLYLTKTDIKEKYYEKPLIIWLQGGPGQSSTGYGNFMEIGPSDINLMSRNHTWVNHYNILFIDNPVGSGFSYVEHPDHYSKTNAQIADDLITFMKEFHRKFPQFSNTSTLIASESYGGKMAVEFANLWFEKQLDNEMKNTLKGVILGSPWISPLDSVMEYSSLLFYAGMVDRSGFDAVRSASLLIKNASEEENWKEATELLGSIELLIAEKTDRMDIFNFASIVKSIEVNDNLHTETVHNDFSSDIDKLAFFMNTVVKPKLNLHSNWGATAAVVSRHLKEDFMKPVTEQVEKLLNKTDLSVYVYNGQLDVAVNVVGTLKWIEELRWEKSQQWKHVNRKPLVINGFIEGYVKEYDRLKMFWINRAGHTAVVENPSAVIAILKDMVENT